ncbi:MAG: LysR family transcriptional regulator [Verrucomicrobiales bacterium]|nr:LysR family transcriptional regulator [Verrucomicrobiales bacterium]MBP9223801.1 LysR family transcriptional regulator [Verrucomicrobiales bacterium]
MDLLDIRQLRAFQELARKGSFTVAAHSLNLTQSAISHSIKALERSLDLPLFERLGKSVRLTAAGEILLPHADRILFRMERAQEELIALGRPGHGRLRVGATVTISQYVLPSVLRELRESFPSFDISVATDDSKGLIRALEAGEIDVAIAMETPFSEKMRRNFLFEDHIEMALSPVHPLATLSEIRLEDVLNENFIIYSQKSETFRLIEQQCARSGIRLKTSLQVGSMAAITEMAKIGMGVGLLSSWVAEEEIAKEQLIFRDLPWDRLSRRWSIHSDPRHESQMIEEVFTGICRVVVDTLVLRTDRFRSPRLPLGSAT